MTTHIDPRRLWSHFIYASTGLVLGFAWLLVLAILLVLGGVLTIVLVGIPILALTLGRRAGRLLRRAARRSS